jgi:hypothetical protein
METLASRREANAQKAMHIWDKVWKLQEQLIKAEALVLQIMLLEVALEDPSITKFSFDANYEYDDESSYYWCVSFGSDGDNADADPWERFEGASDYASEKMTVYAFDSVSNLEGSITVAALQEAVAEAGA